MKSLHLPAVLFALVLFAACAGSPTPTAPIAAVATHVPPTVTTFSVTATPPFAPPTGTRAPAAVATRVPPTATSIPPTATGARVLATPTYVPLAAPEQETLGDWDRFVASLEADTQENARARVEAFWSALLAAERVPLILTDSVLFLYRGDAQSVTWRGDFSFWQFGTGLEGKRVAGTDLWFAVAFFPRDSRTEYKIVLNGNRWLLDPANPYTQGGGTGENNVLTMPKFQVTDYTVQRADVPPGTLGDWVTFESEAWGGPVNYRVYTPPNYAGLENVPTLYVTDGNDFSDERSGAMPVALDNLLAAGSIAPVMAVFIDARDPQNLGDNQRETQFLARPEEFAEMVATELVPAMDARYRTDASPDGRALVGTSYGGVFATFAGLKYPAVFGKLGIFSPAYWVFETPDGTGSANRAAGARRMSEFVQGALKNGADHKPQRIFMSAGVTNWDVGDLEFMAKPLRARGDAVSLVRTQEGHNWGAWRGLTDEMLVFLFGE
jgi:enterochelin esterase family protein